MSDDQETNDFMATLKVAKGPKYKTDRTISRMVSSIEFRISSIKFRRSKRQMAQAFEDNVIKGLNGTSGYSPFIFSTDDIVIEDSIKNRIDVMILSEVYQMLASELRDRGEPIPIP